MAAWHVRMTTRFRMSNATRRSPSRLSETRRRAAASGSSVAGAFGWALIVETGPQAGLTYVLAGGDTLVGRGSDCDIFLGDVTVSRHHARFAADGDSLLVRDLGSTNGTYVNGSWIDAFALSAGDEIIIGKFHLIVARGNT